MAAERWRDAWGERALALIDDVRRDEDQQVALLFRLARGAEQPADDRKIDEQRNAALELVTCVTVRPPMTAVSPSLDKKLVVCALLAENEADVG